MNNNIIKTDKDFQVELLPEILPTPRKRKPLIIGFSGKAGAGKDTAAKLLMQYVVNNSLSVCEVYRFADSLKKFVAKLLNCHVSMLEDREFKEKELGVEWWYWKTLDGRIYDYNADIPMNFAYKLIKPTPRLLLQIIGTDAMRNHVHPNIWVNTLMSKVQAALAEWVTSDVSYYAVITDVRFPNEAKAIEDAGGIVIRINRKLPKSKKKEHESETQLDKYDFKYVINNDEGFDGLEERLIDLWENL